MTNQLWHPLENVPAWPLLRSKHYSSSRANTNHTDTQCHINVRGCFLVIKIRAQSHHFFLWKNMRSLPNSQRVANIINHQLI